MVGLGNIRKVVSFDWDWRSLRIGEARVSGAKVRVRSLVSHPMEAGLAYGNPEGLGQFIRRVLREEGISTRRAIVDIPRDQAVLNTLTLPAAKDEELAGLVRFQIVRELPFPVEEAVVDFAAEPRGADGQQRVLVAAVRNDVLEFYRRVFMQAGLKLERIGLRPYANLVALAQAVPDTCAGRTLFVDVGPALTEIDIVVDGRLVFSRAASVSVLPRRAEGAEGDEGEGEPGDQEAGPSAEGSLETDAQRMVKSLLLEVTRTLEAYRATDPGSTVDRIIVGGSCGVESDLAEALHEALQAPADEYHPQNGALAALRGEVSLTAFAATLGLVLSQADRTGRRFDFLHPKEPELVRRERKKRLPMIAATVVLGLLAGGMFFWKTEVGPKREQLEYWTRQASKLGPQSKKIAKFGELVAEISAFDESEAVWVDELYRLVSVLPSNKEAYVTQLALKDSGKLKLKLLAKSNQTANEIATRLSEMRTEEGKPRYVARPGGTREGKGNGYKFSAEVNVEFYREETGKKRQR